MGVIFVIEFGALGRRSRLRGFLLLDPREQRFRWPDGLLGQRFYLDPPEIAPQVFPVQARKQHPPHVA